MFKIKILIVLLLCLWLSTELKVADFKPSILKPSPSSGYHGVETGPQTQGQILCFGDLNGDQYNDYIAINDRKALKLQIYFWDDVQSQFTMDTLSLQAHSDTINQIEQVMLTDLTADGTQDIIVTYSTVISNSTQKIYATVAYNTFDCRSTSCNYVQVDLGQANLTSMTAPPSLINLQGSTSPGFLIFQSNQRFISSKGNENKYTKRKFSQFLNGNNNPDTYNKVDKHFTSNVDIDGDCHSDLVILSINNDSNHVLQFYRKQTNSKLTLANKMQFYLPVKFYTMMDIDASGTVDIVLVMGETGKQSIHIIYNTYPQLTEICKQNQDFPFNVNAMVKIALNTPISGGGIIQLGDVDSDSFPDLLAIATVNDFRKVILLRNVEAEGGGRNFVDIVDNNANLITQTKNPRQVAFFDLGQDGKLDIFVMVEQSKDSGNKSVITRSCFVNNVKDDTLFIKILPLSQTAKYQKGSLRLSSAFGITMQWRITKLDGYKKISLLNQKSQCNYGTLQLPYVIGGLGRTNNYVEDLTVGYEGMGQKMSWSPIIPDSKLLVYEKNDQWRLETLLTNNERVNHVVYVSICILIVLGIIIFFLNYLENKEDRRDQYNFIQLIR